MKKLNELYPDYPEIVINDIKINSKEVQKGDLFVCVKGVNADRHDYVDDAINNGAVAIIASKKINVNVPVIYVKDTNEELINVCKKFYNYHDDLILIGVTGTNGKTTVSSIIQDLIGNRQCGYLGTNGIICHSFNEKIRNTTPDADRLYKYFMRFKEAGCKYISMETSSEAFLRGRVKGLEFDIGILTNISEDHLNIHKTIENYVNCKKELFKQVKKNGFCLLNVDDKYYKEFQNICVGKVLTYGKKDADLKIKIIHEFINKTEITLQYNNNDYDIVSPLLGEFNVYNLCAAILALLSLGYKMEEIIKNIKNINVPRGRMEFLDFKDYHVILDYAHTPDAFLKVYDLLNKVKKKRIITVTGSAGGREHEKRPLMGKIVLENSNYVIFTMDDPRNEDVNTIIDELTSTSNKDNYERIIDRKTAIHKALSMARKDDIILIAGKGDDHYMAINDEYVPYSDLDVIKEYFN